MPRTASVEEIEEFTRRCLSALDKQVIPLESEAAKISAIQAVRYVMHSYLQNDGEKQVLRIVAYSNQSV